MFVPDFFGVDILCTNSDGIHWMIGAIFVKFSQLILMKIIKTVTTVWSDFKAEMHQIQFWQGSLQRSPDPLAGFKGPTSRERGEGNEGMEGTLYFFLLIYAHESDNFNNL